MGCKQRWDGVRRVVLFLIGVVLGHFSFSGGWRLDGITWGLTSCGRLSLSPSSSFWFANSLHGIQGPLLSLHGLPNYYVPLIHFLSSLNRCEFSICEMMVCTAGWTTTVSLEAGHASCPHQNRQPLAGSAWRGFARTHVNHLLACTRRDN